jgi:uncharacterized protein (DUF486 family)
LLGVVISIFSKALEEMNINEIVIANRVNILGVEVVVVVAVKVVVEVVNINIFISNSFFYNLNFPKNSIKTIKYNKHKYAIIL